MLSDRMVYWRNQEALDAAGLSSDLDSATHSSVAAAGYVTSLSPISQCVNEANVTSECFHEDSIIWCL